MVDGEAVQKEIEWWKSIENKQGWDFDKYVIQPIMEAFGNDVNEILKYLDEMDIEDLSIISGCFEDIYAKFMTDDVYDTLEKLEDKIKNWIDKR